MNRRDDDRGEIPGENQTPFPDLSRGEQSVIEENRPFANRIGDKTGGIDAACFEDLKQQENQHRQKNLVQYGNSVIDFDMEKNRRRLLGDQYSPIRKHHATLHLLILVDVPSLLIAIGFLVALYLSFQKDGK